MAQLSRTGGDHLKHRPQSRHVLAAKAPQKAQKPCRIQTKTLYLPGILPLKNLRGYHPAAEREANTPKVC